MVNSHIFFFTHVPSPPFLKYARGSIAENRHDVWQKQPNAKQNHQYDEKDAGKSVLSASHAWAPPSRK